MKKRLFYFFLILLAVLCIWQWGLLTYGLSQAKGQINVVWNTMPVSEMLANPNVPDSVKQKLRLVGEAKRFAVDSLGINPTENYTAVFDQKGKDIMWVVTACEPFALEAKEWGFPMLGSFPYKGYFDYEKAVVEENLWKEKYDTNIRTAGGWSTLGWFKDPILSNMLNRAEGNLADLIIHELTHGTLYVKDSVEFNENLATFIGMKGAEQFLMAKYGRNSEEYANYINGREDRKRFSNHILNGAEKLEVLYNGFDEKLPEDEKQIQKQQLINSIFATIDTLTLHKKQVYLEFYRGYKANNTFFMSYLRYRNKLDIFEKEYENKFDSNLKDYLSFLKEKYPSL